MNSSIVTGDFGVDPTLSTCPCYYSLVNSFLVLIIYSHAFVLCTTHKLNWSDEYKIKWKSMAHHLPFHFPEITAAVSVVYSDYSHSFHG